MYWEALLSVIFREEKSKTLVVPAFNSTPFKVPKIVPLELFPFLMVTTEPEIFVDPHNSTVIVVNLPVQVAVKDWPIDSDAP